MRLFVGSRIQQLAVSALLLTHLVAALASSAPSTAELAAELSSTEWQLLRATGAPTARHEASFVAFEDKAYLIGGRRINPVDEFDPVSQGWTRKSPTPIELHHVQAVALGEAIYLVGAMTGDYPNETPLDRVIAYYPKQDRFEFLHSIPEQRRRGGAAAVTHQGKIYLVGGITRGHVDGFVPWLDEYDPSTGVWRALPNAQFARDHVQATVIGHALYVVGGRTTRQRTGQSLDRLVEHGEVFDFESGRWRTTTHAFALPTLRAGHALANWNGQVIVAGGESHAQQAAHAEVEAFDTRTGRWQRWPSLRQGRHGSGLVVIGDTLYIASGAGERGGGPELTSIEALKLVPASNDPVHPEPDQNRPVIAQWHTLTLDFRGPFSSESATPNPFTDYRLQVEFTHAEGRQVIRGFYAADGDAAESGADSGSIWRVRFTPEHTGEWSYRASLRRGPDIALSEAADSGEPVALKQAEGRFQVASSDKDGADFRAHGRLVAKGPYFGFKGSDGYWLKTGANSPENLLGYVDFDGTYRIGNQVREGEAEPGEGLHRFDPHAADWREGDPSWREGRGKNLIGAINYLASTGMNASYFLSLNIQGDGKDVWPYRDPADFSRFDCSKLEQWEIVFAHMQAKGILLHLVTQETENERMLDDGEVGRFRQLYYRELIARFGHHLGLVWNLGEENGPAEWSPVAQNDQQRIAMAQFLKTADPYGHPVLLHTHATRASKDELLEPLLGLRALDGLSFQVDEPADVAHEVRKWRARSAAAGHEWLISMDEIGPWHTGALPDSVDPSHDALRRQVLWGTLLAGGAGVEWYFGAQHPHNDLNAEDWRSRAQLWTQSRHALDFFTRHLPFWRMRARTTADGTSAHLAAEGEVYALYVQGDEQAHLDLSAQSGRFDVFWYDPVAGGELRRGSLESIDAGDTLTLGEPPADGSIRDWVALVRRTSAAATTPAR